MNNRRKKMAKELYCDECGELIQGDVCFIGDIKAGLALDNPVFCCQDCLLDFLDVESLSLEDFDE